MTDYRYGSYPRAQRIAILVLLAVVTAITAVASLLPRPTISAGMLAAATEIRTAEATLAARHFRPVPKSFSFDPNTVSAAELELLGLSKKQAAGWLKFRGSRPDAFRTPEDIGKLFVLSDEDKERLIPLAVVTRQSGARPRVQGKEQWQRFAFDPNAVSAGDLQRLGLSPKQAAAFINYREASRYGRAFRKPGDIRRLGTLSDEQKDHLVANASIPPEAEKTVVRQRFSFDPNTISADSLALLGFPEWQTRSFDKYRGGRSTTFREPEDLRRVGALDSALVEEVLDLVNITPFPSTAPAAAPETYATKAPPPELKSFDVNAGNITTWQRLPGIGEYRAKCILKYRNQFGGFYRLEQLAETPGLPDSTFQQILPYLSVGPVVRKIAINRASFDDLKRHPYISRNLANVIVKNREKFGPFRDVGDLNRIRLITDENRPTIVPYLSFE